MVPKIIGKFFLKKVFNSESGTISKPRDPSSANKLTCTNENMYLFVLKGGNCDVGRLGPDRGNCNGDLFAARQRAPIAG